MIRVCKYLSLCGVTSRRGAEKLIDAGQVTINDITVEKPGVMVDETSDVVKVNGSVVEPVHEKVYVLLNKPRRVMTTLHDPFRRRTVRRILKGLSARVYPVGRLDYDTEGVLLLTNDGDLAYRLTHPRYQVPKVYEARVIGRFTSQDAERIGKGVKLEDGATGRAYVDYIDQGKTLTRLRLTLTEGRKREVRQLCKAVGHPVKHLRRINFAGISADKLKTGAWRHLTDREVKSLKALVGL